MFAVRLSEDLQNRLTALSEKTHRSKSFYVKKALERLLEEEEDYADALVSYEEYLRSCKKGFTLDEMKQRHEVE